MGLIDIHIHADLSEFDKKLDHIITINTQIMASIAELSAKVDTLQTALDTEQEQIAAAIAALQQSVTDLQAIVADGGTAEERQALSDKLDAIIVDLQGTIADNPPQP